MRDEGSGDGDGLVAAAGWGGDTGTRCGGNGARRRGSDGEHATGAATTGRRDEVVE